MPAAGLVEAQGLVVGTWAAAKKAGGNLQGIVEHCCASGGGAGPCCGHLGGGQESRWGIACKETVFGCCCPSSVTGTGIATAAATAASAAMLPPPLLRLTLPCQVGRCAFADHTTLHASLASRRRHD